MEDQILRLTEQLGKMMINMEQTNENISRLLDIIEAMQKRLDALEDSK